MRMDMLELERQYQEETGEALKEMYREQCRALYREMYAELYRKEE